MAYAQVLGGGFQYDDFLVIVEEPGVPSLGAWAAGLGGLRPLLKLSYTLNGLADPGPAGFLAVNLGLHLLNTWLVHRLLLEVGAWTGLDGRRAGFAALAGALLFALHPAQTEAVAYISGRSSSLAAAFCLGSTLAYLRGRAGPRRGLALVLSPALFLLGLMVKETALVLPLALVLLEGCRSAPPRRPLRGPFVHLLGTALAAAALVAHPGYRRFLAASLSLRDGGAQARGALEGLAHLGRILVWPAGLNLDPPLAVPQAWTPALAATALAAALLATAGFASLRRRPWVAFGLLWGLVFLLPTQGPVPRLDPANERHLYLAMTGFAFAFGDSLSALPARAGVAILGLLATAAGVATFRRIPDYRDEVTMWRSSLSVAPANPRAWNNLGVALQGRGQGIEARRAFEEALRLRPGYGLAQENLRALGAEGPRH